MVDAARTERLAGLYAPQLAEIEELEGVVAEANMIFDLARVDLQSSSEMEWPAFNEFCKPVEARQNAPWLKRDKDVGGNDVIYALHREGDGFVGRIATPDEARDGREYPDLASYLADRAA